MCALIPIIAGAYGHVYRGSYLGPVAIKAIQKAPLPLCTMEEGAGQGAHPVELLSARRVEEIRAQLSFRYGGSPPPRTPHSGWATPRAALFLGGPSAVLFLPGSSHCGTLHGQPAWLLCRRD